MRHSGLVPGFEDYREKFLAARARFLAAGGPKRCASHTKQGNPCRDWAVRECDYCRHHAPNIVQRSLRQRRLARPQSPEQAKRNFRREAARVQRVIWKRDRWAPGCTVTLGPRDEAFLADLRASGVSISSVSPATMDAARWAWLNVEAGRMTPAHFRDRVLWHAARDADGS